MSQDFHQLVIDDVRHKATERDALTSNPRDWISELSGLIRDISDRQSRYRAQCQEAEARFVGDPEGWTQWKAKNSGWASRTAHFKHSVEDRLVEAKALLREENRHQALQRTDRSGRLRSAIITHRQALEGTQPRPADLVLWGAVE